MPSLRRLPLPKLLMLGGSFFFLVTIASYSLISLVGLKAAIRAAANDPERLERIVRIRLLSAMAAGCVGFLLFVFFIYWVYRRRIAGPMRRFHTTLEDISEGFIVGEMPSDEEWLHADPGVTEAARMVLQINQRMLRTVDNLEKGFEEERLAKLRQQELTRAYERFVPHQFISFLDKESITQVQLGDHVDTEMTIMFSDMRSFTTLSENITPEENFKFLNSYLRRMDPVIRQHGGFIDKYIGDAIMALFYQSPDDALAASIGMLRELDDYNRDRARAGYVPIRIGVGLNTGRMMLGIVGGENRMEGTVISDAVNLASRIEETNKSYGTTVLLSEQTVKSLKEPERFLIRKVDRVQVKGKSHPILIYELYDADPLELREGKRKTQSLFEQALALFEAGDMPAALNAFEVCCKQCPDDPVTLHYIGRCHNNLTEQEGRKTHVSR